MIRIHSLVVLKPFRYLWLKSVKEVDLSKHCAKCLIGEYSEAINNKSEVFVNIPLSEEVYYLCGVSVPYVWSNNFHLAFMHKEGETLQYSNNGIEITIDNAVALPISQEYIDINDPNVHKKEYNTCRNWQFAHYFKKYLK